MALELILLTLRSIDFSFRTKFECFEMNGKKKESFNRK